MKELNEKIMGKKTTLKTSKVIWPWEVSEFGRVCKRTTLEKIKVIRCDTSEECEPLALRLDGEEFRSSCSWD